MADDPAHSETDAAVDEEDQSAPAGLDVASPEEATTPPDKPATTSDRLKRLLPKLSATDVIALASLVLLVISAAIHGALPNRVSAWSLAVPALALAAALLKRLKLPIPTIVVICSAMALYLSYIQYTGFGERNFDGNEQLKYVKFIAENWTLPKADECFVCHHPPAYYLGAAGVFRFFELTKWAPPIRGTQLFSLVTTFAFVVFGTLTVRRFTTKTWWLTLGAALIAFWPYTIMNTSRIHNDPLVTTFMAASLLFLVRWYQQDQHRDIWLASAFALGALLTKTNGYIVVASIGAVVGYRAVFGPTRIAALKKAGPPILAIALAAGAFTLWRGGGSDVDTTERVLGTASKIGTHEWVGNEPGNYLYFDLESYLAEPYVHARRDGTGRQYYWNHLLKSSLFATHNLKADAETTYRWNRRIASLMSFLLLGMIALGVGSLMVAKRERFLARYAVPLIASACFIGFHMAFKAMIPAAHHNDFRLVHPVLITAVIGYVLGAEQLWMRRIVAGGVAVAMPVLLIAGSVLYYLPKYHFVRTYLPAKVIRKAEHDIKTAVRERTKWEDEKVLTIRGDELVEVPLRPHRAVAYIEVTFDHNDSYALEIFGATEPRVIEVGPRPPDPPRESPTGELTPAPGFKGMARYDVEVEPPVERVRAIRVRPKRGDKAFGIGHMVIKSNPAGSDD